MSVPPSSSELCMYCCCTYHLISITMCERFDCYRDHAHSCCAAVATLLPYHRYKQNDCSSKIGGLKLKLNCSLPIPCKHATAVRKWQETSRAIARILLLALAPVASFEGSTIVEEPLAHGGTKLLCCTKTEPTSTRETADELQSVSTVLYTSVCSSMRRSYGRSVVI